MRMKLISIISTLCLGILIFTGCSKDDENETQPNSDFNRKAMLENIGRNVIIPNYQEFKAEASSLHQASQEFASNPDAANLSSLREQFKTAYLVWQKVTPYGFGPANDMTLRNHLNTFPLDTVSVKERIDNNNTSWGPYDNDVKGFPALDYMLFNHQKSQQKILDQFTGASNAANRKSYLKAITKEIKTKSAKVTQKWQESGGNYIQTFVQSDGAGKGSSLSLLVNELNFDYEIIKNPKLGIPLGKKSLGEPFPKKVEAYHSENSIELMLQNLNSIRNLFLGKYGDTNGKGLDDHLDEMDAQRKGEPLSKAILNQFDKAEKAINNVPQPLHLSITENTQKVEQAYEEVQRQVVLLKTDMPSALEVRITYQDNDGD